ncbi:pupal cuticle protein 36-like [Ylistrum balloti]|uniref:pupal cuticle protein 36-like n=1 Tax=Ylistrum balloti TaxID=509963 RepID=UPI002905895F|nr:pupal cuticle protein 36-like [Ylistrum balloti]
MTVTVTLDKKNVWFLPVNVEFLLESLCILKQAITSYFRINMNYLKFALSTITLALVLGCCLGNGYGGYGGGYDMYGGAMYGGYGGYGKGYGGGYSGYGGHGKGYGGKGYGHQERALYIPYPVPAGPAPGFVAGAAAAEYNDDNSYLLLFGGALLLLLLINNNNNSG